MTLGTLLTICFFLLLGLFFFFACMFDLSDNVIACLVCFLVVLFLIFLMPLSSNDLETNIFQLSKNEIIEKVEVVNISEIQKVEIIEFKYCPNCGQAVEDYNFCPGCGGELK